MAKKIIIFGFSHCGTSILKSIIGHIDEVYEIINECNKIDISTDKKFILCKTPKFNKIYLSDKYDSYIKIFIIRNPVYAYSSINERFNYNISKFHRLDKYFHTVNNFVELVNNPRKDIYTIKYEDLFDNNFKNLKSILDKIGFEYDDKIFDNSNYINKIVDDTKFESIKKNIFHIVFIEQNK
ncbi:MAG: hypothetical protein CMF62_03295 [Magnetococcales bacterium]|nr:hypothetical protein [Magnetococcales bacterium]